jgi:hypothetical protein
MSIMTGVMVKIVLLMENAVVGGTNHVLKLI